MPSLTVPERGTLRFLPTRRGLRYHDLLPLAGIAGIGLTLSSFEAADRVYVVVDAPYRGIVAFGSLAHPDLSRGQNLRALVATGPDVGPSDMESACLSQVLPTRTNPPPGSGDHALARAAVSGSRLPEPMRRALNAVLDHGPPPDTAAIQSMRRESGDPMWDTLAMACSRPEMAGFLARQDVRTFLVRRASARRPRLLTEAPPVPD